MCLGSESAKLLHQRCDGKLHLVGRIDLLGFSFLIFFFSLLQLSLSSLELLILLQLVLSQFRGDLLDLLLVLLELFLLLYERLSEEFKLLTMLVKLFVVLNELLFSLLDNLRIVLDIVWFLICGSLANQILLLLLCVEHVLFKSVGELGKKLTFNLCASRLNRLFK